MKIAVLALEYWVFASWLTDQEELRQAAAVQLQQYAVSFWKLGPSLRTPGERVGRVQVEDLRQQQVPRQQPGALSCGWTDGRKHQLTSGGLVGRAAIWTTRGPGNKSPT